MRTASTLVLLAFLAVAQPSTPEQLFRDAVAAQQRGDNPTAIQKYQELLKVRPDVMEAHANLGAVLAHEGRYDEAIVQYRAALAKDEKSLALRLNLALAYYKKGAFADAGRELETLRATTPADTRIPTLLADCYIHLQQDAKVIDILTPVAAAHPEDLGAAWLLGSALIRSGRRQQGLDLVEKVARGGNSAEAWLLAGQTALKVNQFERARDDADAAYRLNPALPGLLTLRGSVLPYLGDDQGAIDALTRALIQNPNDFEAHLNLGAVLHTERKLEEAEKHLQRALQLQPDSTLARYEMARLERTEGKLDAAAADFEKVTHADPSWPQPHIELSALYFRMNRPEDGERERSVYQKLTQQ